MRASFIGSFVKWTATTLSAVAILGVALFTLFQSIASVASGPQSMQPASGAPETRRPSYLAPLPLIPAGTITAIQPLPARDTAVALAAQPAPMQTLPGEVNAEQPAGEMWRVTAGSLNVRREPASRSERLGSLQGGDLVSVLDQSGRWSRVESRGGLRGWVFSKYLERRPAAD